MTVAGSLSVASTKMTDSPDPMLLMPFKANAAANEPELSSIFQPEIFRAEAVVFVTSNQSAPTGLLPLDQGATSEMNTLPMAPTLPGEPISLESFAAAIPPLTPMLLGSVI